MGKASRKFDIIEHQSALTRNATKGAISHANGGTNKTMRAEGGGAPLGSKFFINTSYKIEQKTATDQTNSLIRYKIPKESNKINLMYFYCFCLCS